MSKTTIEGSFDQEDMNFDEAATATEELISSAMHKFVLIGDRELNLLNGRWCFRQEVRLKWGTQIRMWIKKYLNI